MLWVCLLIQIAFLCVIFISPNFNWNCFKLTKHSMKLIKLKKTKTIANIPYNYIFHYLPLSLPSPTLPYILPLPSLWKFISVFVLSNSLLIALLSVINDLDNEGCHISIVVNTLGWGGKHITEQLSVDIPCPFVRHSNIMTSLNQWNACQIENWLKFNKPDSALWCFLGVVSSLPNSHCSISVKIKGFLKR